MNEIGSVKNFGYQPNYNNNKVSAPIQQQNRDNLDAEIKELKKEHSKTRKALIGVSAASALVIGCLLLRNHFLAKKAKVNTDAIKNKLKDAVQKIKEAAKSQNNENSTVKNNTKKLLDSDFALDIIDILTDAAIWV